ncbi:Hypp5887 [Branchiostoma lanceolatum]|uniref:Hypp5887 protein n=1 Tax=Branchiostoma lanceolatum TaxID=7740 RepID=A0A8J9VGF0_BRALA|nr:Hypp5887 [Branchiostoma lanceolatum]
MNAFYLRCSRSVYAHVRTDLLPPTPICPAQEESVYWKIVIVGGAGRGDGGSIQWLLLAERWTGSLSEPGAQQSRWGDHVASVTNVRVHGGPRHLVDSAGSSTDFRQVSV